jgi:hypothetical protein
MQLPHQQLRDRLRRKGGIPQGKLLTSDRAELGLSAMGDFTAQVPMKAEPR